LQRTLQLDALPTRPRRAPQWVAVYRDLLTAVELHLSDDGLEHPIRNRALKASLRRRTRVLRSRLAYWERRLPKTRVEIAS